MQPSETDKTKIIKFAVIIGAIVASLLMIAAVLAFGPVGKYAFADKSCDTNASAALKAIQSVPDNYKDAAQLKEYLTALTAYESKDYDTAEEIFEKLDYYRNSRVYIRKIYYDKALLLRENGDYKAAAEYFEMSHSDDADDQILVTKYQLAEALYGEDKFDEAASAFAEIKGYSDSAHRALDSRIRFAQQLSETGEHVRAAEIADEVMVQEGTDDLAPAASEVYFAYAESLMAEENWESAATQLEKCTAHPEADTVDEKKVYCESMITYEAAVKLMEEEHFAEAVALFDTIPGFLDADELNASCEQEAFSWEFSGFLSKDGTEDTKTKTFVRADTIYFYGTLSGGKPGKSVDLLFVWVDCVGKSVTCRVEDWTDGTSGGVTFSYSKPKYANFGKSTITVYLEDTGEELAEYSFTIKK